MWGVWLFNAKVATLDVARGSGVRTTPFRQTNDPFKNPGDAYRNHYMYLVIDAVE
jgi:hypothetical protein